MSTPTPTTPARVAINGQTPGPLAVNQSDRCLVGIFKPVAPGCIIRIADAEYDPTMVPKDSPNAGDHLANARLLATAYTMADCAGRALYVDAAALCESLDLAALIIAARDALTYLDQQPDAPQGSLAEVAQCGVRYQLRQALHGLPVVR